MSGVPHPSYARHVLAPNFEQAKVYFVPAMLAITRAHCLMLIRQGILDRSIGRQILHGLRMLESEGMTGILYDGSFEDLFFYMEKRLGELVGEEAAGNLQVARSRNDLDATMSRWVVREKLLIILEQLNALRRRLVAIAQEHIETIMPGYTHGQPAQPTTLAHYLSAVLSFLQRDAARLQAAYGRVNLCPLGAVAFTTTGFPIDRDYLADRLGFDAPVENSYDAVGGADYQAEVAASIYVAAASLSRFVTDLLFWSTWEAGALHLSDEFVQISSIMPQKRNPVVLEHLRSHISYLYADAQAVLTLHHNTPLGDTNDIEDPAYRPLFRLLEYAAGVYELLGAVLAGARWNVDHLADRAAAGFTTATELADTLVRFAGLPFRIAHRLVGQLVRDCAASGLSAEKMTAAHVDQTAQVVLGHSLALPDELVQQALDPRHFVAIRTIPGGPAPTAVVAILERQAVQLANDEAWRKERQERLLQAHARLAQDVMTELV